MPTTYRQDLSEKNSIFTEGPVSVAKYFDEFHTLSKTAEVDELEYITVGLYKRGFRTIRDIMRLSPVITIADAFQAGISA